MFNLRNILYTTALVLLVSFNHASATPPDVITSHIVMLGSSSERVAFLVSTGFNHGSYYLMETRWFLLAMNLVDCSFLWESQGNVIVPEENYGETVYSTPDDILRIADAMEAWGIERSLGFFGDNCFPTYEVLRDYFIRDSSLCLEYDGKEFVFFDVRCFNPQNLAVMDTEYQQYHMPEGSPAVRELASLNELIFVNINRDSTKLVPRAAAFVEDVYLVVATVKDDNDVLFDLIFTIPTEEMLQARTFLLD